jgi:hypothetical protein|tara:strand:+ start:2378 stop:2845 length:468 start_codon:yes stop_codon:yes gene_type:complete
MEKTTILKASDYMYNGYDFERPLNTIDLNNKLFCTFVDEEFIDERIQSISQSYDIMYNKMFVLFIKSTGEYVITYNVDQGNVESIPDNTILVHRKKDTNTLYTINALNTLIKSLNGGVVDPRFKVDWQHYRNCVLLTQQNDIRQLNTKVHKIIEL